MSSDNDSTLCSSCSKVKLHPLISGRAKYTTRKNEFDEFWDLSKVSNERNCPLCRLLISCFRIVDGFDFDEIGKCDRICGVYVGRELQVSISQQGSIVRSSYSVQHCAANIQVGRQLEDIKPTYFAIEELRSWLIRCDEGHRECKPSTGLSENPMPRGFRVIDVRRSCIVRGKPDLTYCALSYVWGRVDQVLLNKLNLMELEKDHVLFEDKFVLPKTILDAIKLCQDIGQAYLWVDCLCIIQESRWGRGQTHSA
ncbi:hypothetical protein NA56DRAFT_326180 [Hyaloscypha hepaticicola]|uniref:Heterokaryon incompatibility domain-containing protein n=1 Tax=Hyaloscypha hepaticicola TaxID=2082293 RepID=A0A2J6PP36_9HELO|nr:hypothetical protein NA56DRAFT_326180 [Hyaloscypha hepaticicola]